MVFGTLLQIFISPGEAGCSMEDVIMTNYTGYTFYEGNCSPDNPCQVPYDNGMSGLFDMEEDTEYMQQYVWGGGGN